jgi:Ser/Thr protein kinase RdoA (MazF antagonist)
MSDDGRASSMTPAGLSQLGLDVRGAQRLAGRTEVWRISHRGVDLVLRRNDAVAACVPQPALLESVAWVHEQLSRLHSMGVAVPQPVAVLNGSSIAAVGCEVWEAVSYLPGQVVGWAARPTMVELGAFMARFHDAASNVVPETQRDGAVPVASLTAPEASSRSGLPDDDRRTLADAVECLDYELARGEHGARSVSFIHGDLTNHNLLMTGEPARACGVIDFGNAYREVTLADVGFALWRSGRPSQQADQFDLGRIAAFVGGYHSQRRLDAQAARVIGAYLCARGLQILVKQHRRSAGAHHGTVRRLRWLVENRDSVRACLIATATDS